MLFIVFFLLKDDISINKNIIEEEKLSRFWFLPAGLGQDSLANQNSAGDTQRLTGGSEAGLNKGDAPCVGLRIY